MWRGSTTRRNDKLLLAPGSSMNWSLRTSLTPLPPASHSRIGKLNSDRACISLDNTLALGTGVATPNHRARGLSDKRHSLQDGYRYFDAGGAALTRDAIPDDKSAWSGRSGINQNSRPFGNEGYRYDAAGQGRHSRSLTYLDQVDYWSIGRSGPPSTGSVERDRRVLLGASSKRSSAAATYCRPVLSSYRSSVANLPPIIIMQSELDALRDEIKDEQLRR